MNQAPDLPLWAALAVGLLTIAGALCALIGSIGLVRMQSFYDRLHPPTIGSSAATAFIVVSSMICFSVLWSRPIVHEVLIMILITLSTPVTFMLLARAALYRDRMEGADVPPASDQETSDEADELPS